MFTQEDFSQINKDYFIIRITTPYNIHLISKNTKHHWVIQPQTFNNCRILTVLHRHGQSGEFHIQPRFHPHSVDQAQELIKSHDKFQLNGRRKI